MKIKKECRNDARNDDTERCRKDLEHIVRVLDHRRDNQSANSLNSDHRPYGTRVPSQEALLLHRSGIFKVDSNVRNKNRR